MVVLLTFSFNGTTYAATKTALSSKTTVTQSNSKLTLDDATNIAVKALSDYFDFKLDPKLYQSNSQLTPGYAKKDAPDIWNLSWYSYNGNNNVSINAGIDSVTGKLLSVNKYDTTNARANIQIAKYTEDQCQVTAEALIKKISPDVLKNTLLVKDQYALMNRGYSTTYDFKYVRLIDGIEYDENYIDVVYDGVTGKLTSYSNSWDDSAVFPPKGNVIDVQTATDTFSKQFKMKLQYIPYRNSKFPTEQTQGVKLAYVPDLDDTPVIDATTAAAIKLSNYAGSIKKVDLSAEEKAGFVASYKEISKPAKELDKDSAQKIATDFLAAIMTTPCAVDYLSYSQNSYNGIQGNPSWTGQFKVGTDGNMMGSVSIDAVTGQIVNLNNNMYPYTNDTFTPKISWKEAYNKSIDIIKMLFPDKVKELMTEQMYYDAKSYANGKEVTTPMYNFNFSRIVNGIGYSGNAISITFDAKSGNISSIYFNWDTTTKFPEIKNVISSEDAHKIYMDNTKLALGYVSIDKSEDSSKPDTEIKLAYLPKTNNYPNMGMPIYLDATSGKLLSYNGEDIISESDDAFDKTIKGNKYEKELAVLKASGVIDTKDFKLDKAVTKLDMIRAMVMTKTNGNGYYSGQPLPELSFTDIKKDDESYLYLQKAVSLGILKNEAIALNLDKKVTREGIMKYLVDCTPFSKLADSDGIFALTYTDAKDIDPANFGDVAIAKGLKIIDDATITTFNPKGEVQMDEFAHYLYNTTQYVSIGN